MLLITSMLAADTSRMEYLAAVEEWHKASASSNSCCSDNLYSLLKNATNDKQTATSSDDNDIHQLDYLNQLAQDKVLEELSSLYEEYTFATAKDASLTDDIRRGDNNINNQHSEDSLVYGEIDLHGFVQLLLTCNVPRTTNDIFYDLGSGSGRAVFAARYCGDYKECIGIELLQNLHDLATSVQSLYKFQYKHKLKHQQIRFVHSDLLDYESWWSNGTVVYIPNLLFDDVLMDQIADKAKYAPSNAYWICLKKFRSSSSTSFDSAFELIHQCPVAMSWGESNVYVYRRCT